MTRLIQSVGRLVVTSLTVLALFSSVRAADESKDGFKPLFDGKTLKGWEGQLKWFRVEGEAVVAGSLKEKIPNNEFLCTEKTYKNFELRLKAKLVGEGSNAGIQFRTKRIPNHHEVSGYQCDMGLMGKNNIWGSLYDESRRKKFLVQGPQEKVVEAVKLNDWNQFVIRAEGKRIQIWVNGVQTVDFTEEEAGIEDSGIIGLQIHSGPPSEASYKELMIKELP